MMLMLTLNRVAWNICYKCCRVSSLLRFVIIRSPFWLDFFKTFNERISSSIASDRVNKFSKYQRYKMEISKLKKTYLLLTRPRDGDLIFFSSGRFLQRRRDNWNWFKFSPRSRNSTELRNWLPRFEPPATIIPWIPNNESEKEYLGGQDKILTNLPATSRTVQPWPLLLVSKDGPRLQDPDDVSRIRTWSWSTSFLLEQPLDPDFRWNPPIRKMNLPAATAQFPLPRAELGWLLRMLHCCDRASNIWTWMRRHNE